MAGAEGGSGGGLRACEKIVASEGKSRSAGLLSSTAGRSYRWHAGGEPNPLVNDHDLFLGLGASEPDRQCAYREFFRVQIPDIDIYDIRECLASITPWAMTDSGSRSNPHWAYRTALARASTQACRCTKIIHYDPFYSLFTFYSAGIAPPSRREARASESLPRRSAEPC